MREWKKFDNGDQSPEDSEALEASQERNRQLVTAMETVVLEGVAENMHPPKGLGDETKDKFGLALQNLSRLREVLESGYHPPFEWKVGVAQEAGDHEAPSKKTAYAHVKMAYYDAAASRTAHFSKIEEISDTKLIAHIEADFCTIPEGTIFSDEFCMNEYILGLDERTHRFVVRMKSGWFEEPGRNPVGTEWREPGDAHLQQITDMLQTVYQLEATNRE